MPRHVGWSCPCAPALPTRPPLATAGSAPAVHTAAQRVSHGWVQVDPTLSRTVVVSTKFDTRIPQFATAADADAFLHPSASQLGGAQMLGGSPFFTSVPSGRVGGAKDSVFRRSASCLPCPPLAMSVPGCKSQQRCLLPYNVFGAVHAASGCLCVLHADVSESRVVPGSHTMQNLWLFLR